ncbi:MAG: PAS domain S-box protein [Desulforhopalus sp.]
MFKKSNTDLFATIHERHSSCNLGTVLTQLVDVMDIAIWELDRNYQIVSCNHKASETYGEGIVGEFCYSVTTGGDGVCSNCPVKKTYHSHTPHRAEQSHRDLNGNKIFVEHFATPIITQDGELFGALVLLVDITRHKKTEKKLQWHKVMQEKIVHARETALAKSESKFAVAFDASPDAININRLKDGLYVEVNQGFTDLTGYTSEDVVGKTSQEIDIWADPSDRRRLLQFLSKDGYCENFEADFRKKDGELATALMSARVISLNDQPHIISITRDITKIKEMKRKLATQQRLFETMFNAIGDGIVITNTRREIQLANKGMTQTFGYTREELLGKTTEMLYADQEGYLQAGEDVFNAEGKSSHGNFTRFYRHKNGRNLPVSTFAAKLFDQDGQWIGNLGIMRDITEQQKSEAERDKLIAAVHQTKEAIVITDQHGIIEFVNPAFEEITGYSKNEVIGENPRILQSGNHDVAFYKELWDTITGGETFTGRIVNKRKDGSVYTEEATISPVIAPDGKISNYIAVKRDITRQLTLEEQLMQSQKMEAIGRLTGGIAHDFNNMLGVILGYSEMALDKTPPEDKIHGDLQKILDAARRSAAIVRQLLAFSRKQTIAPRKLELNSTVEGMLTMLHRLIGEDIHLDWSPHSTPLPIKMDSAQMDQVLTNLCINAKDAIGNDGTISIQTGTVFFDERSCSEYVGCHPGDYVMLTVSDNGHGIKQEDLDRIYEPFFTTKASGSGTGLGLSTVYGILKQNNSFIEVCSKIQLGTTVKIYFPFCYEKEECNTKNQEAQSQKTGKEKVLLVEDDISIRTMVQKMLVKFGYTVITADNPLHAIKLASENNKLADLLITDVVMPEMNGRELTKRLQEIIPQLKCLYMSGYTENVIANKTRLSRNIHFIEKPFSSKDLLDKVLEALHQKPGKM